MHQGVPLCLCPLSEEIQPFLHILERTVFVRIYKKIFSNSWLPENNRQMMFKDSLFFEYLKPYTVDQRANINPESSEFGLGINYALNDLCCMTTPSQRLNAKRSNNGTDLRPCKDRIGCPDAKNFYMEIQLKLNASQNAFCPPLDQSSNLPAPCKVCKFRSSNFSEARASSHKVVRVHDVRLCGHPVLVFFQYERMECKQMSRNMRRLPGVSTRSYYNQVRFSVRLTQAINKALAD